MENFDEKLAVFGFNEKEKRIVVALFTKNSFSVSALAAAVKLPRTTIHTILLKLENRGFVRRIPVQKHREWAAADSAEFRTKLEQALTLFDH